MSNNKDFKVKNGIQPTAYHEAVGTVVSGSVGYNLAGASYDSVSFSVNSQDANPTGVRFSNDGTKMYMIGYSSDRIYQYNLSTAFDLGTASYSNINYSVSSQATTPYGLEFNSDGTKMYVMDYATEVQQYSLSTAFDLSSVTYDSKSLNLNPTDSNPIHFVFNNNGTKLYMLGTTSDSVFQFSLSTAYDVSTGSYDSVSFSVASEQANGRGLAFNADGTQMYIVGFSSDIFIYNLSTAFDISTASYSGTSFSVSSEMSEPHDLTFNSDGTKMYIISTNTDSVHQYSTALNTASLDLSTGSVFEITPTSDIQVSLTNPAASGTSSGATLLLDGAGTTEYDLGNASYDSVSFSVASQDTVPFGLAFNNDGTKMYTVGNGNDSICQYSLSRAFDLSTASYDSVSFSVNSQDSLPRGIVFNTDGTKIYMVGSTNDSVYQYSLSTAFNLSTASYDSVSFSVTSQDGNPLGLAFNNDGSKMYMLGNLSRSVHQYTLSTAFDLSTASYDSVSFSVNSQDISPEDISFKPDGTKMYVLGGQFDSVYQYSLSTAFNLSTASYDSVSFSVASEDDAPSSIVFNSDGTKMYMVGFNIDSVHQYSTATPAIITYDSALQWSGGTAPTSPAIGETDVLTFNTTDGGTTYQAVQAIDGAK
jgi:DNA-binding beta-propeller fold protein YncE